MRRDRGSASGADGRPVVRPAAELHPNRATVVADELDPDECARDDDLDRCDSAYVVELLEGIQTLFQHVRVTYVIAADRKWICSSFDKVYGDFGKTIGQPGRPLGYLFLEKVFQISASVPRLSPHVRQTYWNSLLHATGSRDPERIEATRKQAEVAATNEVKDLRTPEDMERKISAVAGDPVRQQAMRAAAAKQMATPEVQQVTEHRLQRFSDLLETNPRSMKRFVNAYGLMQSTHLLEGRSVSAQALAQWTIIELRWPLLAEHLSAYPDCIEDLNIGALSSGREVPRSLRPLFTDRGVKAVVEAGGAQVLTEKVLRDGTRGETVRERRSKPLNQPGGSAPDIHAEPLAIEHARQAVTVYVAADHIRLSASRRVRTRCR